MGSEHTQSPVVYLFFGLISGILFNEMTRQVNRARVIPKISLWWTWRRDPRNLSLVFRKHRVLYPSSNLRLSFWTCLLLSLLFFGIFIYESESARVTETDSQSTSQAFR